MIQTVEGKGVGAGKSYYVTTQILQYLSEGGTIFASSSFVLDWDASAALVLERYGVEIERDQWNSFEQTDVWKLHEITPPGTDEKPVLIIIDEAHTALNARDWADKAKRPFFDWLTQSRHDNNDLIFISQSAANIDKQIARLVTYIIRVRNMANFEFPGIGKWPFKQFVVSRFDQDGKTLMRKNWISHDKKIFGCYRSKSCGGSHRRLNAAVAPRKLRKRKTRSPMVKYVFVIMLALCAFTVYRFTNTKAVAGTVAVAATAAPASNASNAKALPVQYVGEGWRGCQFPEGGAAWLRTDAGLYMVGHACKFGMVEGIEWPNKRESYAVAKVRRGDNGITYIAATFEPLTTQATQATLAVQ